MVQSWAPGDCRLSSVFTPVYVYFFPHCRDIARMGAKSTSSPKSHCSPSHNKSKSNTFVGERVLMDMIWVGCRSLWGTFGRHAILPMRLASMRLGLGLLRLLFAPVKQASEGTQFLLADDHTGRKSQLLTFMFISVVLFSVFLC